MNLFFIEGDNKTIDLVRSARSLDNRRISKMAVEAAQLLSTALYKVFDYRSDKIYKPTHINHPCTLWVSQHPDHWCKVLEYLGWLILYQIRRFNNGTPAVDRVFDELIKFSKDDAIYNIWYPSYDEPSNPPMCMPIEYQDKNNIVESYRRYYSDKDEILYNSGDIPHWFIKYRTKLTKVRINNKYHLLSKDDLIDHVRVDDYNFKSTSFIKLGTK